mmetsp:Transcript_39841/g.35194  ORF Transcript_39841/g.35194 Transcript_39841/m.35194 type:complete len:105 (-) Transcript_39841:99-413(-)
MASEEKVVLHKWSFNLSYNTDDQSNPKIIFTVSDAITEKTWVKCITKAEYGNDVKEIGKAYDKLQPEIDACSLACQYPENGGALRIQFKNKDGSSYADYDLDEQ